MQRELETILINLGALTHIHVTKSAVNNPLYGAEASGWMWSVKLSISSSRIKLKVIFKPLRQRQSVLGWSEKMCALTKLICILNSYNNN